MQIRDVAWYTSAWQSNFNVLGATHSGLLLHITLITGFFLSACPSAAMCCGEASVEGDRLDSALLGVEGPDFALCVNA